MTFLKEFERMQAQAIEEENKNKVHQELRMIGKEIKEIGFIVFDRAKTVSTTTVLWKYETAKMKEDLQNLKKAMNELQGLIYEYENTYNELTELEKENNR